MKKSLVIRSMINIWKYPIYWIGIHSDNNILSILEADAERILNYNCNRYDVFACLVSYRNFAAIYNARMRSKKAVWIISRVLFRYNKNIEILTSQIGKGFIVYHNLGAVIRAKSIGENVTISQGVTIGEGGSQNDKNNENIPTIGNNVLIATNALVLGDVTIGDNAIVGAGSIIVKDVPANAVVVGNPQRIIKYSSFPSVNS